jgi:hypothetical protein
MAELLPGQLKESIRVTLRHRTLSYLPTCSAVSYEWGLKCPSTRNLLQWSELENQSLTFIVKAEVFRIESTAVDRRNLYQPG